MKGRGEGGGEGSEGEGAKGGGEGEGVKVGREGEVKRRCEGEVKEGR